MKARPSGAPDRLVLLDFDGTLAYREGIWSGCILELLDEQLAGHGLTRERIRAAMAGRYLWNTPTDPHPQLRDPDAWWEEMERRISTALVSAGLAGDAVLEGIVRGVRHRFVDPSVGWSLFEDTIPALQALRAARWETAVLSNHVPELEELARALGVLGLIDRVFSSAVIGYEKPHPEAFRIAVDACGAPDVVWMVGDNLAADVGGAEAVGIPAILVRSAGEARRRADDLIGAVELIQAEPTA